MKLTRTATRLLEYVSWSSCVDAADVVNCTRKRSGWVGVYVLPFLVFTRVGLIYGV
jgi:hypothetical protein